jgi:hypothetical protein
VTQAKVRLLQYLSQLLNDELINLKNQQPVKCSELVFVQHNPLYDDDDDDDVFDQQSVKEQHSDTTSESVSDKVESIHEPTFQEFSCDFSEENLSMMHQHEVNHFHGFQSNWFIILFPSPSSNLGKKSSTTRIE